MIDRVIHAFCRMWLGPLVLIGLWLCFGSVKANAQLPTRGQDAVYSSGSVPAPVPSPAFVDASVFRMNTDICTALNAVLSGLSSPGAVIDARAIPGQTGTSLDCTASGANPWGSGTSYINVPSTILLPSGIIKIPSTWVLPANTHIVGEGEGIPSAVTPGTQILAGSSSVSPIIQFGQSSMCPCSGISIENLTLNGNALSVNGIVNANSGDQTYVNHVSLYQVLGTGLQVTGSANNSGPYSHITFDTGGGSTRTTVCAQILNVMQGASTSGSTRGIHGLSCTSQSPDAGVAILLDSSNNSLEDIRMMGFYDGIRVGENGNAESNILINIIGDTGPPAPSTINTVHIEANGNTVADLAIVGLSNMAGSGTYSLRDDVTGTDLLDAAVGIYVLGESPGSGAGYSRYSTSPNLASWSFGQSVPPSGTGVSCARGSLYSCIGGGTACASGTSQVALWACALSGGTSGTLQWMPVR